MLKSLDVFFCDRKDLYFCSLVSMHEPEALAEPPCKKSTTVNCSEVSSQFSMSARTVLTVCTAQGAMLRFVADCRRLVGCLLFFCLFHAVLINTTSIAQGAAQVEADEEEAADAAVLRGALPRMNRQQMEEYMYGSLGGSKAAFHKLKRESIRRELDRVHSICTLTEEQWSKLNEAIEVDIQHLEIHITSLLSYDGKMTPQVLQEMQQKVWQFASSIQNEKEDDRAVWRKVLNSQLTNEQSLKIKSDESKKLANQARTMQLKNLLSLQRKLGLNASQRVKIDEWLGQVENRELDFAEVCRALRKSTSAVDILSPVQLKALEKTPASIPLPLNRILPARDLNR